MIQRIQSIYLLVVVVLLIVAMCLPVGNFVMSDGASWPFSNLNVQTDTGADTSPWGMFAILLLSSLIAFATIFLYKNRMLQIRMSIFSTILLIGYYIVFVVFMFMLESKYEAETFQVGFGLCLPLVAIVLNYLAIRAIGKDEILVKAADRLR